MITKLILLLLPLFLLGSSSLAQRAFSVGEKVPDFTAFDQNGVGITLSSLYAKQNVVLVFYRGQWCKYCNRIMFNLNDSLPIIENAGARVIAITPENNDNITLTQDKTLAGFSIIYDEGHRIMDEYNLTWELSAASNFFYRVSGKNINKAAGNEDRVLPVPATYIIDTKGEVIAAHFDRDYTKRMPVSDILKVLGAVK